MWDTLAELSMTVFPLLLMLLMLVIAIYFVARSNLRTRASFLEQGQRQQIAYHEQSERQIAVLERIAAALEKTR